MTAIPPRPILQDTMDEGSEKKLDELLEIVTFIKDNAAMQVGLDSVRVGLDSLKEKVSLLNSKVDSLQTETHIGFAHTNTELQNIRSELKEQLDKLDKRTEEDINALVKDQMTLRQDIKGIKIRLLAVET